MFGFRDEAGSDGDVTVFFTAQRAAVLELSALSFLSMRFWTGSIINGEDGFGGRPGRDLVIKDFKADGVESIDVPV